MGRKEGKKVFLFCLIKKVSVMIEKVGEALEKDRAVIKREIAGSRRAVFKI